MRAGTNYYSKQSTLLLAFTQHKSWQCCCATLYRHWLVFLTFVSNLQFTYYTCCFVGCFFVAIGVATFYTLFILSQFLFDFFQLKIFTLDFVNAKVINRLELLWKITKLYSHKACVWQSQAVMRHVEIFIHCTHPNKHRCTHVQTHTSPSM